jgi:hypothetical protein
MSSVFRRVLTQNVIDTRLAARVFLPVSVEHVRVEAQGLVHLAVLLWRSSFAAPHRSFGRCTPADFASIAATGRDFAMSARPFGVVVGREALGFSCCS